jgi:riboflavin kinase/FMN adenylyltransferase
MIVVHDLQQLEPARRAVAIGVFDGVHMGHRAVIGAAVDNGRRSTVLTFDPHPRVVLGYGVQLLASLERRIELIEECGVDEVLVAEFTPDLSRLTPSEFAQAVLEPVGAETIHVGADFRFGHGRGGDVEVLRSLGYPVSAVDVVPGVSSSEIRASIGEGDVARAAGMLGRPFEVAGDVVVGDRRGGTLGFPTANLAVDPTLLVPAYGIYAGQVGGKRVAMSVGINPHYGGTERRIEAHLIDFNGDLYGEYLTVEVWQRLRGERAFENENALVQQIDRDVADARAATRPG